MRIITRESSSCLPAAVSLLIVAACSDNKGAAPIAAGDPDLVTVVGEVTQKDDRVGVDGGVTMTLKLDNGETETLFFRSLFTDPPASQQRLDLYDQVIDPLKVGDRVSAVGRKEAGKILLEDMTILKQ